MSERQFTVTRENVLTALQAIANVIKEAVLSGNVIVTLSREKRNSDQNKFLWAVLTDVSKQVIWHGQTLTPEEWKHVLSAAWKGQKAIIGVDGGIVMCGVSTSKLSKRQFSELIEVIFSFGSERGVVWGMDAVNVFEEYRK